MNRPLSILGITAATVLIGTPACTGSEVTEQYQRQVMIGSNLDVSVAPSLISFDSGASILMDVDDGGELVVCVLAQGGGDCVFAHQGPGLIGAVEQLPHCLNNTVALSFEIERDYGPSITVYYKDGAATLDRDQAREWFEETPGCGLLQN